MSAIRALDPLVTLSEDISTAWIPDVLANADLAAISDHPTLQLEELTEIWVPRPGGGAMQAYALPPSLHLQLHHTVDPLRDIVDSLLRPTVCGYRRGAQADESYRSEHDRFMSLTRAELENRPYVLVADIENFFQSLPWDTVLHSLRQLLELSYGLPELFELLERKGVRHLPPGYADARMLANLVLHPTDAIIPADFTRWVDDYRIFLSGPTTPVALIADIETNLRLHGLHLNPAKVRFISTHEARGELLGKQLDSVYHPGDDIRRSRADLRAIFFEAAVDPIRHRRLMRFSLPRLAEIQDDVALDFTLSQLNALAWEAPRFVAYIDKFADRPAVRTKVVTCLEAALLQGDQWLIARLSPLAAKVTVPKPLAHLLVEFIRQVNAPALWGLALRILSLSGYGDLVKGVFARDEVPDPRAALAAAQDVGLTAPPIAHLRAPLTSNVLNRVRAPRPSAQSIL